MTDLHMQPSFLIVEDSVSWASLFTDTLKDMGEVRSPMVVGSYSELAKRFVVTEDFERVSFCLVDLELGPGTGQRAADTHGRDKVLPHIRALAPWVPIACLTRYISGEPQVIGELSASDFDYFCPKEIIAEGEKLKPEFNAQLWKGIVRAMRIKRTTVLTGRSLQDVQSGLEKRVALNFADTTRRQLQQLQIEESSIKAGLALAGIEGSEISMMPINSGHSGVFVSRVIASGNEVENEPTRANWLLKWGRPISKLAREAIAHRRMFRRGLNRSLQIPQLNGQVVSWDDVGFLAYAYEQEAQTAREVLGKDSDSRKLLDPLQRLARGLYTTHRCKAIDPYAETMRWCSLDDSQVKNVDYHRSGELLEVTWSLIHGDLHLQNIFIKNNQPTLVDFARSDYGPIAVDAAKLAMDILAFCDLGRLALPPRLSWGEIKTLLPVCDAFAELLTCNDDVAYFDIALRSFGIKYLEYDDVSAERREWIRAALG